MADKPVVHIGENSPEEVAYKLLRLVIEAEKVGFSDKAENPATREWLLDTYAECFATVRGSRSWRR